MNEVLVMIFTGIGAAFVLLAAIGIVRMPDFYLRMSVTTKAATLGVGLILIGAALYFSNVSVSSRVIAIILFLLLTAPIGAHMIGRTSYFIGTKLWDKSVINELKDQYDEETHELYSEDQSGNENVKNQENKPSE
ncbi:MAG TPA: monovalent cation/H(+) antiporter subunit G [Flavisolibacter sp.]|jgi:multicomponent Na+:H+ antiporter subunit G|nr:monovalent cation/H(+) antiporter subunit G [Flavisolibacter sp.]